MFKIGITQYLGELPEANPAPSIISDGKTMAWFDSQKPSTIFKDGSNFVSAWIDRLGGSKQLSQSLGYSQPLYTQTGVTLDGSSQYLKGMFSISGSFMVYLAATFEYQNGSWYHSFGGGGHGVRDNGGYGNVWMESGSGNCGYMMIWGSNSCVLTTYYKAEGYGSYIKINNTKSLIQAINSLDPSNNMIIGVSPAEFYGFHNMNIKAIILRTGEDTDTNSVIINNWLRTKYSI